MKKILFISMVIVLLLAMASCQKDQNINSSKPIETVEPSPVESGDMQLKSVTAMTEYAVSPRFGIPNSTYYAFKVNDITGTLTLAVKLYDKATGTTTYLPMTKIGTSWMLSVKLPNSGWYDYRYVYNSSKANISSITYSPICNTKNTFSASGISSIGWPFGADGSNYGTNWQSSSRTIYVSPYGNIAWRGGQEGGSGDGWNQGSHIGSSEQYSDDWNRGTGSQDLSAIIRSPLDGYIENMGTYSTSAGNFVSKYVSIIQEASDGKLYRFYVGHLQSWPSSIFLGKYVRAGIDQIGTLGMSGATSPHAHTNMRVNGVSVKFYFNAQ